MPNPNAPPPRITDYTGYDDIRAVLGVAPEEIENTTLQLDIYAYQLGTHFEEISDGFKDLYDSLLSSNSPTQDQKRFLALAHLYSTYCVAYDLLTSLPMFAPKRITDGKAETERIDAYADTKEGIKATLASVLKKLKPLTALVDITYQAPAAVVPIFAVSTGIYKDPVTSTT